MITAETLTSLTSFTAAALSRALAVSGHEEQAIESAQFLGITNAGQFCYSVTFPEENARGQSKGKVFLTYDSGAGTVTAGY
jgi:hypothetical protein